MGYTYSKGFQRNLVYFFWKFLPFSMNFRNLDEFLAFELIQKKRKQPTNLCAENGPLPQLPRTSGLLCWPGQKAVYLAGQATPYRGRDGGAELVGWHYRWVMQWQRGSLDGCTWRGGRSGAGGSG
jgi:hypothetical protein